MLLVIVIELGWTHICTRMYGSQASRERASVFLYFRWSLAAKLRLGWFNEWQTRGYAKCARPIYGTMSFEAPFVTLEISKEHSDGETRRLNSKEVLLFYQQMRRHRRVKQLGSIPRSGICAESEIKKRNTNWDKQSSAVWWYIANIVIYNVSTL